MASKTETEYRDEYRQTLQEYAKEAQNSYDQTLIALSGGALGISFAFIDQIVGSGPVVYSKLLATAWICWTVSLTCVLFSFYTSHTALQNAIQQVDGNKPIKGKLGGIPNWFTSLLNFFSGLTFVVGVIAMIGFTLLNLK